MVSDPHRDQPVLTLGAELSQATAAVILLHGRGASAEDILGLATEMYDERFAYLAPQAAGNAWYPYSFMAPLEKNEPWLSSALAKVGTHRATSSGCRFIARSHICVRLLPGRLPVERVRGQKPRALWRADRLHGRVNRTAGRRPTP